MSGLETYLWIACGVVVAIVLPVLRAKVASDWPSTAGGVPDWVKKYGRLLMFSLLTALVLLAFLRSQDEETLTWWSAFLAGFAWEAGLEKLSTKTLPAG